MTAPSAPLPWLGRLAAPQLTAWLAALLALLLGLAWLDPAPHATRDQLAAWFVAAKVPFVFGGDGPVGRPLVLPLPGGVPLLAALVANLLAAAAQVRGRDLRALGLRMLWAGAALAAAAAAVAPHVAKTGVLALAVAADDLVAAGDRQVAASTFVGRGDFELALLRDDGAAIEERVVPAAAWRATGGVTLRGEGLPFRVELHHASDDCDVHRVGGVPPRGALVVGGAFLAARRRAAADGPAMPGAYVKVVPDDGASIEGLVVGHDRTPATRYRAPFVFHVGGRRYGLDLRPVLHDLPHPVELAALRAGPGGDAAVVTVRSAAGAREVEIARGEPLVVGRCVIALAGIGAVGGRRGEPVASAAEFRVAEDPTAPWFVGGLLLGVAGLLLLAAAPALGAAVDRRAFAAKLGLAGLVFAVATLWSAVVPGVGDRGSAAGLDGAAVVALGAGILAGAVALVGLPLGWARAATGRPMAALRDLAVACGAAAWLAVLLHAWTAGVTGTLVGLTGGAPPAVLPGLAAAAWLANGARMQGRDAPDLRSRWRRAILLLPVGLGALAWAWFGGPGTV